VVLFLQKKKTLFENVGRVPAAMTKAFRVSPQFFQAGGMTVPHFKIL
jgi:hypothetical protein